MSLLNFDDNKKYSNRSGRGISNGKTLKTILGIGALVGVVTFGSTLAASINLNSNGPVEFGQGVAQTSACDDSITVTPTSHFANNSGGGSFALSTIELSGIDSSSEHCYGKTFTIKGYSQSGLLSLVSGVSSVEVTDMGDSFGIVGSPAGVTIGSTDGTGFTLTFNSANSPVSAGDLYRITVESTAVGSFIVSAQSGSLQGRASGTATYAVTTYSINDGSAVSIQWFESDGTTSASAPTGISASATNLASSSSTVTVSADGGQSQGYYYFKVSVGGNLSSLNTVFVDVSAIMIGDVGAGGGRIFYINEDGFSCGTDFTSTGSPTGGLCHYLEVAPNTWTPGSSSDGAKAQWLSSTLYTCNGVTAPTTCSVANNNVYDVPGITNVGDPWAQISDVYPLSQIGIGYKNSIVLVSTSDSGETAGARARSYTGGGKSDWYLPSAAEMNQLCYWVQGTQAVPASYEACATNPSRPGIPSDFEFWSSGYWTSSERSAVTAYFFNNLYSPYDSQTSHKEKGFRAGGSNAWSLYVRPIRAY